MVGRAELPSLFFLRQATYWGVCKNTMHRRCFAERAVANGRHASATNRVREDLEPDAVNLPSFMEICEAQAVTREFWEPGLLSLAETEVLKCISKVISNDCVDAWSIDHGEPDRTEWRRCRSAWQELHMFCKTCIQQLPGGQNK